jgi:predicted nucleic acid-binding Zn ribbon protein/uncharacterized tellurite resistance protein B-like protein
MGNSMLLMFDKFWGKNRTKRRRSLLPASALAALALLLTASFALARAGGGEGFHSGGGGGGGGGDGGGGGGGGLDLIWLVFQWLRFCVLFPQFGLPITAVVIVAIYVSHRQVLRGYQNSVIRRGATAGDLNAVTGAVSAMRAADPAFDAQAFYLRVKAAFMKIQNAWSSQDLTSIRPFVSDGIYERFSLQIDEQKALGYRDRMENIQIGQVSMADVDNDGIFDVASVRVEASAADFRVSLSDGRRLSGSQSAQPFVEYWSFMRRRGAKTDAAKSGLIEGNCPNCGAAIAMNQSAKCDHCGAILRSGQFDWVLAEITQDGQWRPMSARAMSGTDAMRQTDPAFNRLDLEDRASVMFWRKSMTDRAGKIDPIRKIATEEFCGKYQANLKSRDDHTRVFYGDCAVGAANLWGVVPAGDGGYDKAVVQIAWEGERMNLGPEGAIAPTGQRINVHTLFVMIRKQGVSSDPGLSASSAHCPHCGAPMTSDLASACSFCGTVLNDGSRGWVLDNIVSASSPDGQALLISIRPQLDGHRIGMPSAAGLLAWAVKEAVADGTLQPDEQHMLASLADKFSVDTDTLNGMIRMAQENRLQLSDPPDGPTARIWLEQIAATALADGSLDQTEISFLLSAAQRFGLARQDVEMIVRQQRALRLAGARENIRTAKAANSYSNQGN